MFLVSQNGAGVKKWQISGISQSLSTQDNQFLFPWLEESYNMKADFILGVKTLPPIQFPALNKEAKQMQHY